MTDRGLAPGQSTLMKVILKPGTWLLPVLYARAPQKVLATESSLAITQKQNLTVFGGQKPSSWRGAEGWVECGGAANGLPSYSPLPPLSVTAVPPLTTP